ncbi:hypothetical protein FC88_GL001018 [Companilactobacillus futsaii JCM 17355]|uniref:Uncharacterized protein n=1 Tax=Companilactobacillus futsaii JCM 17355 TaxID=1423818 RepID=A0ABR5P5F9_9LACO|nr:hypothetical protein FC88_GL001018 [Companilactobacillus futsaii JCM 17355]
MIPTLNGTSIFDKSAFRTPEPAVPDAPNNKMFFDIKISLRIIFMIIKGETM